MKEIILLELLLLVRLSFILLLKKGETNKCGRNVSGIIIVINILEHTWKVNKYTERMRRNRDKILRKKLYSVFVNPSLNVNVMSFYIIQIISGKSDVYMHLLILFTHI